MLNFAASFVCLVTVISPELSDVVVPPFALQHQATKLALDWFTSPVPPPLKLKPVEVKAAKFVYAPVDSAFVLSEFKVFVVPLVESNSIGELAVPLFLNHNKSGWNPTFILCVPPLPV